MPTVEKTHGGEVLIRPLGQRFSVGDQADVDDELARYLTGERGDFALVDDDDIETQPEDNDDSETDVDETGFDEETWLDQDYGDRADQVRAGDVDEHLETIDEIETSDTVRDAVGERRAELEAEG